MALTTKLSPPQISSKLPAFVEDLLTIPFNLNRAVGRNQFNSMSVIIRTVSTNIQKAILTSEDISPKYGAPGSYEVKFQFNEEFQPRVGQYYKVQLACIDDVSDPANPVVGYYSTVGVIKYTARPGVIIKGRENGGTTNNTYEYTGLYSQENKDPTEKVYTYCFDLYDENNNLIATSGEQIHDSTTDTSIYESTDIWTLRKNLDPDVNYQIEYSVTTMNGFLQPSGKYLVIDATTLPPNVHASLSARYNTADGYIDLSLIGDGSNTLISGSFILLRSSNEDNYDSWYELTKFQLTQWDATSIKYICRDYTIQQGVGYKYAIQAYNSVGLYSDRMLNREGEVSCDFEDAFLYDGDRQLKIRFNPKVSSFKSTVLESKTETIGGRYPFIFRNGNVEYKEFQISGLLSLLGDENNEFKTDIPLTAKVERFNSPSKQIKVSDEGHWLTSDNYYRERQFKMQALEWLNNGKPKLFRSSAEGNFIVRLMNVSLTPNDTLGRMLHTFNCTAYEIAECNFDNLRSYGFLVEPYLETRTLKMRQIDLNNYPTGTEIVIPSGYIASLTANPMTQFEYILAGYSEKLRGCSKTGTFNFGGEEILKNSPLLSVTLLDEKWGSKAYLTYGYYDTAVDTFSYIHKIDISDQIVQQSGLGMNTNIVDELNDVRKRTGVFHYIRVKTKIVQPIQFENGRYQIDDTAPITHWNVGTLYEYVDENGVHYYLNSNNMPKDLNQAPSSDQLISLDNKEMFYFQLNDSSIVDFAGRPEAGTTGRYEALTNLNPVDKLYAGQGLILDIVYQLKEITYTVEIESSTILGYKSNWQYYLTQYENSQNEEDLKEANRWYSIYTNALENALRALKEEYNIEYAI